MRCTRRLSQLLALVLVLFVSVSAASETWAIVVGVAEYDDPSIQDLLYSAGDAVAFAHALTQYCEVAPENLVVLLDEDATRENIRQSLYDLSEHVASEDTVLIYFSGHGSYTKDIDGDEQDGDGVDEVLLPSDSIRGNRATYVYDNELGYWIAMLRSKSVVIFLDTCYSGGQGRTIGPMDVVARGPVGSVVRDILTVSGSEDGRVVLAACQAYESAYGIPALQHGLFTYYLLEGMMTGKADSDQNARLDIVELAQFVVNRVSAWSAENNILQHPVYENPSGLKILLDSDSTSRIGPGELGRDAYYVPQRDDLDNFRMLEHWVSRAFGIELPAIGEDDNERAWIVCEHLYEEPARFSLHEVESGRPIGSPYLTDDFWSEIGVVLHFHGPPDRQDVLCAGGGYKATYDFRPNGPLLVHYWYLDDRSGEIRTSVLRKVRAP